MNRNKPSIIILERRDLSDNEINIDYTADLKPPPFEKQKNGNENDSSSSDSNESENVATEESLEDDSSGRDSDSKVDDSDDDNSSDYDEPLGGGDGQGGGVLGLLAGLSGGVRFILLNRIHFLTRSIFETFIPFVLTGRRSVRFGITSSHDKWDSG